MYGTKAVEKITKTFRSINIFTENLAVYEIMWEKYCT